MTILVTGANGQLGNEMRIVSQPSKDRYIFTDVVEQDGVQTTILDITNLEAIRKIVRDNDVKVIVNCAAYTNVDGAESNQELAELLNAKAPQNLAIVMKEVGGLLVHISTDYVFGKEPYNTPCREDMVGTPTGVYGLTKLHGEQNIMASGCKYVIIRTAWLYSEFGKNFVRTMLNLTATRPELKVVFDQVGTPTYAYDLAQAIVRIIERPVEGIYHYSNEGVCSWYDFTKMIAEYCGQTQCNIQPCHSDEFPSPVKRPAFSVLDKTKIKQTFGITIPYWVDSLKKCLLNIGQYDNYDVKAWEKAEDMSEVLYDASYIHNEEKKTKHDPKRDLSAYQLKVLEYIEENEGCSVPRISEDTGIPCKSVERHVSALKARGFVVHRGSRKAGGYYVVLRRLRLSPF